MARTFSGGAKSSPPQTGPPNSEHGPTLNIDIEDIRDAEVVAAIKHAGGIYIIASAALKFIDNVSVSYLHHLMNRICNMELWNAYQRTGTLDFL